jgi:hypothetical protein
VALLGAGCGGDTEVVLALSAGASCESGHFAEISTLAVDVYGTGPSGELCIQAKRCIFDVRDASGPADIEEALARADPPLIDVPRDQARWIAVVGHTRSCWSADDQVLCGFADLADTADGILDVGLQCGDCTEDLPFCP